MIEVEISSKGKISIISIIGKLDLSSTRKLEAEFKEEIMKKPEAIYFDMAATDYIDSSGIGTIIRCMNWAKKDFDLTLLK